MSAARRCYVLNRNIRYPYFPDWKYRQTTFFPLAAFTSKGQLCTMFGKGNAMVSMVSIFLVLILAIGANPAYLYISSCIVNPESTHFRTNINENPLPIQKNVSVKMYQNQYKLLEKQGLTRFKSIIGWELLLKPYYFHTNEIDSVTANTDENGNTVKRISYDTYGMPTFTDAAGEVVSKSTIGNNLYEIRKNINELEQSDIELKIQIRPLQNRFESVSVLGKGETLRYYVVRNN